MNKAREKVAPATRKRGADAHFLPKSKGHELANLEDKKLEQGLEKKRGWIRSAKHHPARLG
jgi:hypothetical protein